MSDDKSRFGGLKEDLDADEQDTDSEGSDTETETAEQDVEESDGTPDPSSSTEDDRDTSSQTSDNTDTDDTDTDETTQQDGDSPASVEAETSSDIDLTEPAFPYKNEMHSALYVRQDIWEEYERTQRFEIERTLDQHGVRNPTGRELGTAAIETVLAHPEEVAERLLERRGLSIDLTDE